MSETPPEPVLADVRRIKEARAARCNYNIRAMAKARREQQKRSGHMMASLPCRRVHAQQG